MRIYVCEDTEDRGRFNGGEGKGVKRVGQKKARSQTVECIRMRHSRNRKQSLVNRFETQ
jgi:hypothetical protein